MTSHLNLHISRIWAIIIFCFFKNISFSFNHQESSFKCATFQFLTVSTYYQLMIYFFWISSQQNGDWWEVVFVNSECLNFEYQWLIIHCKNDLWSRLPIQDGLPLCMLCLRQDELLFFHLFALATIDMPVVAVRIATDQLISQLVCKSNSSSNNVTELQSIDVNQCVFNA